MNETSSQNPIDQTDEYLEWLAGRRDKEPPLDPAEQDIAQATRLLGTLREHDPRPALTAKIKHAVLATSQHIPPAPVPAAHRFNPLLLWKIASPTVALAIVAVTVIITRPGDVPNHAGTNFTKSTPTDVTPAVIELTAAKEDALGVEATTTFTLTTKEGQLAVTDVEKNFALTPAVAFAVAKKDDTTFEITPKAPLTAGTVYAATYQATPIEVDSEVKPRVYSWAYQVRSEFQIIGMLPRHQATGVSQNTGLEVTFSAAGVTAEEFAKNLTISPAITGRVEVHQRTLVYIPDKPLAEKTVYTVTVKAGLKPTAATAGLLADEVIQFETAAKNEKDAQEFYQSFFPSEVFETVRPDEPLVFSTGDSPYGNTIAPKATQFTVYQYQDLTAFMAAMKAQAASRTSWAQFGARGSGHATEGLKKVGVYKTTTKDGILTLGPGFAKGFYLADGGTGNDRAQIPFVVSSVGSYSLTTTTDSLVWTHDLTTKRPLVGAMVTIPETTISATTGADGTARFPTPTTSLQGTPSIAVINDGTSETPVLLNGSQYNNAFFNRYASNTAWWSYLSTDRGLYQPDDTVQFWGLLRRRDQPRPSETITAKLVQRTYDGRYEPQTLASATLTTSSTGTFIGSLPLRGVATNTSTELMIEVDGETVLTRYLSIETYRKPPFQILIEPNHLAAIAGDTITYKITTQFYDGTPLPNVPLRAGYTSGNKALVTTNAQGQATHKVKIGMNEGSFSLEPTDEQLQGVTGSTYVQVYESALELVAESTVTDTVGTLTGTVYQLQPEKLTTTTGSFATIRGPVKPNQTVDGKLIEIVYDKTKTGSHYDYLQKETVDDYQYTNRDEIREEFTLTSNASGTFQKTFTLLPDSVYRVDLTTKDSQGRETRTSTYFWRSLYNSIYSGSQYTLTDIADRDGAPQSRYAIGETVNLQLQRNGEVATIPADGAALYLYSQRGLRRYAVSTSPTQTFSFSEGDVPSISSRAVIFTGTGYAEAYGPAILFDSSTRALTIGVTADKPTYNPGDRVQLDITTTDPNGRGQSARVNLKAIDEAFLSLDYSAGSDVPLNIYNQVDDGVLGTYSSHQAIESRMMAEGGGGDGGRTDFRDTALFTEITTDAQGHGSLTFTLPDNLTSWRLTAQGFTVGLYAGVSQTALTVSKDIFVNVALESDQLSRDATSVMASAYGRALNDGEDVNYTFAVVDVPNSEIKRTVKAQTTTRFNLPTLAPGVYRVRVAVEAKGKTDTVELPVTVSASRLVRRTTSSVMLPSNVMPTYSNDGRTTFRFDDADRNLAYETLWGLVGAAYHRLDDVVADQMARRALDVNFDEPVGGDPADLNAFLTGKGLALYPIGSENLEYAALAAGDVSIAPARQQLVAWFRGVIDDPKQNTEQVVQALYGLAQLDEPVLPELRAVLAAQDLADADRLTALLGLEALGAKEEARPGALAMFGKYGQSQDQYVRLNLGESDDDKIVASARFAILASGLGLDERYGLIRYAAAFLPKETRTTLERALAVEHLLALAPPATASVTYEVDGKSATAELTATKPLILNLDAAQAKSLKVTATTGRVGVVSAWQKPFDVTTATREAKLVVTRTYLVDGKKTTTFALGDIVRVQFSWTKKSGVIGQQYSLTDFLPTGLRPVSNPWAYDRSNAQRAPYAVTGQRVNLYAGDSNDTFYYLARASAPGKTVAEPAILQAFDAPSSVQYSNEAVVEIK